MRRLKHKCGFTGFVLILILISLYYLQSYIRRRLAYIEETRTLVGLYCHLSSNTALNVNDRDYCSFENIDGCQSVKNRSILFQLSYEAGFASEMNNLLSAFVYAIATRRHFLIDKTVWNYGDFEDYFDMNIGYFSPALANTSFCRSRRFVYLQNTTIHEPHVRTTRDAIGSFDTLTGVFERVEYQREQENLPALGTIEIKRYAAHYLWKTINNKTKIMMKKLIGAATLPKNITFGIHIRQGDKIREAPALPMSAYISAIEKIASANHIPLQSASIFVASDVAHIITQLKQLRTDLQFYSLSTLNTDSTDGHIQTRFNHLSPYQKQLAVV